MWSTYFFFLLVIVVSYAQGISDEGIATVTVPYSGMIPRCNSCTDQNTVPVSNMTCNSDPSWRNGIRTFADPIPQGYVAKSINVTFYCTFGCTDYVGADALVTIDGPIVNFIPKVYAASDCDCDGCMQEIHVSGVYPSGWPRYIYGGDNTIRITAANTSICVSHAIISIEYSLPTPEFTTFRPALIPVNSTENITIIGNDFLSSMKLKCSFGGFKLTNTTYVDSSQLTCPAPAIPVANSIEFQVIDEEGTAVLSGNFSWYYEPTVHSFYPTSGPSSGGVDVILEGAGFFNSSNMACKFGDAYVFSVEYINSSTVSCINVSGKKYVNATSVEVFFSENQQDFVQAETGQYQFTGPAAPTTTPSSAGSPTTDETGLPNYAWVGISLGIILLCILIAGITVVVLQNRKSKKNQFERSGNIQYDEESKLLRDPSFNVDSGDAIIPMDEIKNLRQIEKGSFGVIYEATWHGTKIAVKKLPAALTDKLKNEFFKEANLMKSLRHPNILQYLGVANTGREMCICMEFMSKGSLYRILHNPKSKFSRDKIKSICLDTVRGMNYLHAQNPPIVHRDLKTHNLLVDRHWQVKVCDFGLSRITAQNQTMTACGTPSWTAPEVLRNERYTTKADVYGFGVVVWEMFSRTDPFPGMPPFQIVFAVGTQKLRPKIESDWPLEWVNLITTCWSEDPNARPSFEELIPILEGMREAN